MEKKARRDDATAHKQALTELRDEWKERLASVENQAQEAERSRIKEQTKAEALAARLDALEARDTQTTKKRSAEDQPSLFEGDNPV